MKFVFVGSSNLSVATAILLVERGYEVIIAERDRERIQLLSEIIDCGFLHGDGSKPTLLKEAGPGETDVLFCLTGNDQTNIIASLVGRSLGFREVVTRIEDEEFEHICLELGLENFIVPARTMGRHLADFAEGQNSAELSSMIKGDARLFAFVAGPDEEGLLLGDLRVPQMTRIICIYRGSKFIWPDNKTTLREGDEAVLITHTQHLKELQQHWGGRDLLTPKRGNGTLQKKHEISESQVF